MALREIDAIGDAIIATEKEIAGDAWGQEETEQGDAGDRSLEELGEGLEGQQEPEDDESEEETSDDETPEGEGEAEESEAAGTDKTKPEQEVIPPARDDQRGRVPPARLREANERARAAEAERDALKAQIEKVGDTKALSDKLELALRQIDDLRRAPPRQEAQTEPPKAPAAPDLFEDPTGFVNHLTNSFQTELAKRDTRLEQSRVENSMAIAHAVHKDTFEKAFAAINQLDPRNPEARATVQRIYTAPNPGMELVNWHKRQETLARVGDDPSAYEERIRTETRQALMQDPEFRKQLLADLRGEAARGDNGAPRTTTRLPQSLARSSGSNLGAERSDPRVSEDSEQSVADAAWR